MTSHPPQSKNQNQSISASVPFHTTFSSLSPWSTHQHFLLYLHTFLLLAAALLCHISLLSQEMSRYSERMCQVFITHFLKNGGGGKIASQRFPHLIMRGSLCKSSVWNLLAKVSYGSQEMLFLKEKLL